jgi:hypothetical protein
MASVPATKSSPSLAERRRYRAVLVPCICMIAIAATALSACGDTTPNAVAVDDAGIEASPSNDATADADADAASSACTPHTFGSRKCTECANEKCCGLIKDCQGNVKCNARMDCTYGCFDEVDARACAQDCNAKHGDPGGGDVPWNAMEWCVFFDEVNGCDEYCSVDPTRK